MIGDEKIKNKRANKWVKQKSMRFRPGYKLDRLFSDRCDLCVVVCLDVCVSMPG